MTDLPKYVLITPARNEAEFITLTLDSVVNQTVLPEQWTIVSDGSTDGTDEIVQRYAVEHHWIRLLRMPERRERHFAGKVMAFNAGWEDVKSLDYDVICNLDADVSFGPDYFEFLLTKFKDNPNLGVAGTPFKEGSFQYDYRFTSIEHVSGQVQLFRRRCFEAIGGYVPRKIGGIDHVAVISARMSGWQTRTFLEKTYNHHRKMGSATANALMISWRLGEKDYALGSNVLFEAFRCVYQATRRPYFLGGALHFAGYTWSFLKGAKRQVPHEIVAFRKKEQMKRLKRILSSVCRFSLPNAS